jgi:molybdenum cofactor cytidylyltransferase
MRNAAVSAIVLAAGEAIRMGVPKQLLKFGQNTIIEHTIDNLLDSEIFEVIVVLGYKAERVAGLISDRPIKLVTNKNYEQGISSSISAGLKSVQKKATAVMFCLADQPFIDSQTINKIIQEFAAHHKGIAIPYYQGQQGNPVIFSKKYIEDFFSLKGDTGGSQIISRNPDDILRVDVPCRGVIVDIDTRDNYLKEINRFNSILV